MAKEWNKNIDPIIQLQGLDFAYQWDEEAALTLKNIHLTVGRGEWVAIIGPNGSGKSTLVKTLNGILPVQKGQIRIDGQELTEDSVWDIRKKIGMVFQNPDNQFVGATVGDDVAFGLENQAVPRLQMIERVEEALEIVGMLDFIDREPSSLSGGQKQRVAIGGILALYPDIIVLDEATSMLDPKARHEVIETIRQIKEDRQLTVLSITHDINEAAKADRIVVMKDGQIIEQGSSQQIFSKGETLIDLGLDLPFGEKLKHRLKKDGLDLPDTYLTAEELRDELWTYDLKD